MKVAFLTTDNREQRAQYHLERPYFGTAPQALLDGFAALGDEIEVHVISCAKKRMTCPEKLADNIWFHQPIVPHIGWGRTAFLGCGLRVRSLLRRIHPDVVHAQGTERDCAVSMLCAPKRIPRVLTIHGHMRRIAELTSAGFGSYYWLVSRIEKRAVQRADAVVAISSYTEARLEGEARQLVAIPNAVDESFFKVERSPEPGLALVVAHFNPWKQQLELMQALDTLPAGQRPRLRFLGAAGAAAYDQACLAAIEAREWCEYGGEAGREQLRQELSRASFVILPSLEDNCPMVVLEAMAAGVPVAASRVGGIPDLVEDGVTGRLFDPKNAGEIADVVGGLAADTSAVERLGREARARARTKFHSRSVAMLHVTLYKKSESQI